jgi:hypothetical protein
VERELLMAQGAHRYRVEVEVAEFERSESREQSFDLPVSGAPWHRVDRAVDAVKAVNILAPESRSAAFLSQIIWS